MRFTPTIHFGQIPDCGRRVRPDTYTSTLWAHSRDLVEEPIVIIITDHPWRQSSQEQSASEYGHGQPARTGKLWLRPTTTTDDYWKRVVGQIISSSSSSSGKLLKLIKVWFCCCFTVGKFGQKEVKVEKGRNFRAAITVNYPSRRDVPCLRLRGWSIMVQNYNVSHWLVAWQRHYNDTYQDTYQIPATVV